MSIPSPETIFNPSEFFIETPVLKRLEDQLHHWLRTGMTGGLILGKYRIGKTRAIEYVSSRLINRYKESIPVKRITISLRDVRTVASVFKNLCFALDIPINQRTTADDMANDLTHCLGEMAIENTTKQVVLIVDEMQRLNVNQINAFSELYDNLSQLKINLSVFFVGNLGSSYPLLETIMDEKYELIRGRFFTHTFDIYGLQNRKDIHFCLKEFDKYYTEYYLPNDFKQGWRLASLSSATWDIFEDNYKKPLKLDSWAMQYFIAAIRILLVDYLPRYDVNDNEAVDEMIIASIDASGLAPNLVVVA